MQNTTPSGFVDVHTHVVPSGDDGAQTLDDAFALCTAAADAGTRVLFATPHMHAPFDQYRWSAERERMFDEAFEVVKAYAGGIGLELRRGREVFPTELAGATLSEIVLEGTSGILVEFPGNWLEVDDPIGLTLQGCNVVAAGGLVPVLAHPERCRPLTARPWLIEPFVERGWPICLNGGSLLGAHGPAAEEAGWWLLEQGAARLVASDAHRPSRPPDLRVVYEAIADRLGSAIAELVLTGDAVPWSRSGGPGRPPTPLGTTDSG